MARKTRTYDKEYKAQAVKLAQEVGDAKAAAELIRCTGRNYILLGQGIQRGTSGSC